MEETNKDAEQSWELPEDKAHAFYETLGACVASWQRAENEGKSLETWLCDELGRQLIGHTAKENEATATAILDALTAREETKDSLRSALNSGRTQDDWLKDQLQETVSDLSPQQSNEFLDALGAIMGEAQSESGLDNRKARANDLASKLSTQTEIAALTGVVDSLKATLEKGFIDWASGKDVNVQTLCEEAVCQVLDGGQDNGLKAALACGLKVAKEKDLLGDVGKALPDGTCADIAAIAVDNVSVLRDIGSGKVTLEQGVEQIERNVLVAVVSNLAPKAGARIGAAIGTFICPGVGPTVGAAVGAAVGQMAGPAIGEAIADARQSLRHKMVDWCDRGWQKATSFASRQINKLRNKLSNLLPW